MANNVTYKIFVDKLGGTRSNEWIAAPGDLFYDPGAGVLRLGDGSTPGGVNVTIGIDNSDDVARADASGAHVRANGAVQNGFVTIEVSGQPNVVAITNTSTLVLAAGNGISIVLNGNSDNITISTSNVSDELARTRANAAFDLANVRAGNAFSTIAIPDQGSLVATSNADSFILVPGTGIDMNISGNVVFVNSSINTFSTVNVSGQGNVVADSNSDTLTLVSGNGISITTNTLNSGIIIAASNTTDNYARAQSSFSFSRANALTRVLAHSAVPIQSQNSTSTLALATVTIAGGSMGANGWVECMALWSTASTGNNKVVSIRVGSVSGFSIATLTLSTQIAFTMGGVLHNRGSESAQITSIPSQQFFYGTSASSNVLALTTNTTNDFDIIFAASKTNANDTLILEQYKVMLHYVP